MNLLLKETKRGNLNYYEAIDKDTDTKIDKITHINFSIDCASGPRLTIETLEGISYNGPCHLQILPMKKEKNDGKAS